MHRDFVESALIVLMAGGESSRFRSVSGSANIQKSAYILPSGETMIERTIDIYRAIGFRKFLLLVYHNANSLTELLGDGSKRGIKIEYCHDPEKPVGKGGAIKNAAMKGYIPEGTHFIVHNPDDQLVEDASGILERTISAHLSHEKKGAIATAVMVEGVKFDFTGFKVSDGFVEEVEMYPLIRIPTHIGMTVFSPAVLPYFDKLFDLNKKSDFEAVLFPILKDEHKLAAHMIPESSWISVNDEKGLKRLISKMKESAIKD